MKTGRFDGVRETTIAVKTAAEADDGSPGSSLQHGGLVKIAYCRRAMRHETSVPYGTRGGDAHVRPHNYFDADEGTLW